VPEGAIVEASGRYDARGDTGPNPSAFRAALDVVETVEPAIASYIRGELGNQRSQLKLIASENYASPAVLLAMGNWFSDKYAEGTPGHRFYAGCEFVDKVEVLAADHAKALFGANYAYVQPHSGIDANLVAFWSILAHRVEAPCLASHEAKHVNDLNATDWEELRRSLEPANDRHGVGCGRPPHPWVPAEHLGQDVRPTLVRREP